MKKGLILEGGAMRGLFTAGVLDVMLEQGIAFDGMVGVSAGAIFGCNFKSGQIGRVLRYNTRYCRDPRFGGFRVLLKTGDFYSRDFCYGELPDTLDIFDFDAFERNPLEFHVVCTDVETGKPVYHRLENRNDHRYEWLRASGSMPLVSRMVEIEGLKLLDGGISDSIPLRYFERLGFDRSVVVLTQPEGYRKKKNSMMPLVRALYRNYPNLVQTMADRHVEYNDALDYVQRKAQAGRLFVIRPAAPLPVKRTDKNPENLRKAYEMGRAAALGQLEELKAYLSE